MRWAGTDVGKKNWGPDGDFSSPGARLWAQASTREDGDQNVNSGNGMARNKAKDGEAGKKDLSQE